MHTKGFYIKELHKVGIRRGDKNGAIVPLQHLKTASLISMYYEHCVSVDF